MIEPVFFLIQALAITLRRIERPFFPSPAIGNIKIERVPRKSVEIDPSNLLVRLDLTTGFSGRDVRLFIDSLSGGSGSLKSGYRVLCASGARVNRFKDY